MHDIVIVGIPLLAILAGIFLNRSDYRDLRGEMNERFAKVDAQFAKVDAQFGRVDTQLGALRTELRAEMATRHSELLAEMATRHSELLARFNGLDHATNEFYRINRQAGSAHGCGGETLAAA